MSGRLIRRVHLVVATAVAVASFASCIHSDVEVVDRIDPDTVGEDRRASAALVHTDVGTAATTEEGNDVTVAQVSAPTAVDGSELTRVAASVEVCAAADGDGAPVAAELFRAVLADGGLRRPAAFGEPGALEAQRVLPGECASGTVSFPLREDEDVVAIALFASSRIEWRLG